MNISQEKYREDAKTEIVAQFSSPVLTKAQYAYCHDNGVPSDNVYMIACDMAAGYSFKEAFNANH